MPDPILHSVKHNAIIMTVGGRKAVDIAITLNISLFTVKRAKGKLKKFSDVKEGKGKPSTSGKINAKWKM